MKKTNLKEKLQNWKLGNYFRELSIVTAYNRQNEMRAV